MQLHETLVLSLWVVEIEKNKSKCAVEVVTRSMA